MVSMQRIVVVGLDEIVGREVAGSEVVGLDEMLWH